MNLKCFSILILSFFFCLLQFDSKAQTPYDTSIIQDKIFDNNIYSVQFHLNDLVISTPIIDLAGTSMLTLSFDDLYPETRRFTYNIKICNYDWTPNTNLTAFDYLIGFSDQPIKNYVLSFNTQQKYTHFELSLPNENCKPKKSGNYILQILDEDNNVIMNKRFLVTDNKAVIKGNSIIPRQVQFSHTNQQLNFTVDVNGLDVNNVFQDIKIVIQQDQRPDNVKLDLQPQFVQENVLTFNCDYDCLFPALKEFRRIDIRTPRFKSYRVAAINNDSMLPHFYLFDEPIRSFKNFVYEKDCNGCYFIEKQEAVNQNKEADYGYVHFTVPMNTALESSNLYICGQLTNWEHTDKYKFKYNSNKRQYEACLFLKNGVYDYLIGEWLEDQDQFSFDVVEGNWYETENEYNVYVYYKPFSGRYDQLVGVNTIRTKN